MSQTCRAGLGWLSRTNPYRERSDLKLDLLIAEWGRMKLGDRQPGTSTAFLDARSAETILRLAADLNGLHLVAFHLYDAEGFFVAKSEDLEHYPDGVTVHSARGELLLSVPKDLNENIQYRLYNRAGDLLTTSDGLRTMVYQQLKMEGDGRTWAAHRKA